MTNNIEPSSPSSRASLVGGMPRVLLIDDEPSFRAMLVPILERVGFTVRSAESGELGLTIFRDWVPDIVLLDLSLPGLSGIDVCKLLRAASPVPILILSVAEDAAHRHDAFAAGATDYLVKGIDLPDLLNRMSDRLADTERFREEEDTRSNFARYGMRLDHDRSSVSIQGRTIALRPKEYEVLRVLAFNGGAVVGYRTLLQRVWGPAYEGNVIALRVFITHLREKLEADPTRPRLLESVDNVGFRLRGAIEH